MKHTMTWTKVRISCLLNALKRVPRAALGGALIAAMLTLLPETGRSQNCAPVPAGIVGWWMGDNTAQDAVGGAHGTLVGNAGYASGQVGAAFTFDGSGDAVNLGNPVDWRLQDFTIEAWIKQASLGGNQHMILSGDVSDYGFGTEADGTLFLSVNGYSSVRSEAQVSDTGWHHVAVSKSGSAVVFFVDGIAYPAPVFNAGIGFTTSVAIGAPGNSPSSFFNGLIDEVSLYARVLSAAEVAAVFAVGSSGKCISSLPRIFAQPQSLAVVVGASASFSVLASGRPTVSYQWRRDNVELAGHTNAVLNFATAEITDGGGYTVVVSNALGSVISSVAILQVLPANAPSVRINNQLAVGTVRAGGPATLTVSGGYSGGYIFYTLDGSTPSTSSPLYSGSMPLTNSATIQAMSLSADFSQTAFAPPVTLQIDPTYPLGVTVSGSGMVSLNPRNGPYLSNSVVTLVANPAWNWVFDRWTGDLSGSGNPASITMNGPRSVQAVFTPTAFPLTVSSPGGGGVTVNGQPNVPSTYYPTGSVVSVAAIASNGWTFVRWEGSASGTANPLSLTMNQTNIIQAVFGTVVGRNIVGSGSILMSVTNPVPFGTLLTLTAVPAAGHQFVTWNGAVSGTANPATLSVVNTNLAVGALFSVSPFPVILTQPTNVSVVLGGSAAFSVTASGAEPMRYQWRKAATPLAGATNTSHVIPATVAADAGGYDVVVENVHGSRATSVVATLTVLFPPGIAQQPQSRAVIIGSNVTFAVTASGTPPFSYQWRKDGVSLGGAMGTSHAILGVTTNDVGLYDAVVANPYGAVTSGVAALTVVFPPAITSQPASATVAAGTTLTLSVAASGTEPFSYQWHNLAGPILDATNASYVLSPVLTNHAGAYSVVVANRYGAVTSTVATVTVFIPVTITGQPLPQVVAAGETATFHVIATGYPEPAYQWLFNGTNLPGAFGSSLVITNVGTNALGPYHAEVWNAYSAATSAPAMLLMSPSIRGAFVGATVTWGKPASISVSAVGSGTLGYQWFKDGAALAGATNATLDFPTVQISDGGLYSVVVSSLWGSTTNVPAQLVVNAANIALGMYAGVTIEGVPGYTYAIQYSTDLTDTNAWVTATNLTLVQPVELWVDTSVNVFGGTSPKRYYRVRGN